MVKLSKTNCFKLPKGKQNQLIFANEVRLDFRDLSMR